MEKEQNEFVVNLAKMMNKDVDYVQDLHKNPSKMEEFVDWLERKFSETDVDYLTERFDYSKPMNEDDIFGSFHSELILGVEKKDDYFCGIRANHFCVEIGWSEMIYGVFAIVTGNHKGTRVSTIFKVD